MDNTTEQQKDLYDRFFDDLEQEIAIGNVYTSGALRKDKILSGVLSVIKKYSANPHEPISYENNNK